MISLLYLLIGKLLRLLVKVYVFFWKIWQSLDTFADRSYDFWRGDDARERYDRATLKQCKAELTKRPKHMVIIISPNDRHVDAMQLKRLFDYALIVGIEHISVYDKRHKNNGYVDLTEFCPPCPASEKCRQWYAKPPIEMNGNGYCFTNGNGKSNGCKNGTVTSAQELRVHAISNADCHALIADVCRRLYEKRSTALVESLLQKREALAEQISLMLKERLDAPEPELGIIFANQTCTYGVLPWHIRFTEFHTHPSTTYFSAKTFANILYKYSRCEQRWGK